MKVLLMILMSYVEIGLSRERFFKLVIEQSDGTLDGLGCAIDDPLNQSGGKFDTFTKTCTKLPRNWFSNPTFEMKNNYFRLTRLGRFESKESNFDERVPPISVPGGLVSLIVESTSSPTTGWTEVVFKDNDSNTIMLHQLQNNKWCFDAKIGSKECSSNTIDEPSMVYKLVYSFTTTNVEVFTNSSLSYTFRHRFDVTMYQRLRITYSNTMPVFVCKWMAFKY